MGTAYSNARSCSTGWRSAGLSEAVTEMSPRGDDTGSFAEDTAVQNGDLTGRISARRLVEHFEIESRFGVAHMLQAFTIALREGLEAFLIVAISLGYLRKSARQELLTAVRLARSEA
jgi:hypothetical protein